MTAIPDIEILPADRAQALAIGPAQGSDGYLQQGIFADQRRKVDLRIFGHDQAGFADRFSVKA